MVKELERILDEIEEAEWYKKMADEAPTTEMRQMFAEMAQDEEKHAKYLLRMYPEATVIIDKLKMLST